MRNWAYNLLGTRGLYTIRNDFPLMNICKYIAVRVIKLIIGPPKVYWLFMNERYRMDEVNYSLNRINPGLSELMPELN